MQGEIGIIFLPGHVNPEVKKKGEGREDGTHGEKEIENRTEGMEREDVHG